MEYTIPRVPTGIPGMDKLIQGGFEKHSSNMVRGGTGTGKTIFSIQFLYGGLLAGENGIFISFGETKDDFYTHSKVFGWDFEAYEKKDKFGFLRYPAHEVAKVVEGGGGTVRDLIESLGAKRLVIDSLTAYAMPFQSEYSANQSILDLFEMLRDLDCTTLVTSESSVDLNNGSNEELGYLVDSITNMYYVKKGNQRVRLLEILKMRNTDNSNKFHTYEITRKGIMVKK